MKITKGDIFYRYADGTNDEDEIQEVELYVALDASTDRKQKVRLMNVETEEGWEILNKDIGDSDLVKLIPDYYVSLKDTKNLSDGSNQVSMHMYVTNDTKIGSIWRESNLMFYGYIGEKKSQFSVYKFMSYTMLNRVFKYCYPTMYQFIPNAEIHASEMVVDTLIMCSGEILNEVKLPNTIVHEGRLQNLNPDFINCEHPHVKEFEDAIRYTINPDDYMLLPLTPQFEVEKIRRIHRIIRVNNGELYIMIYTPIESYISQMIKTDEDTAEIYRYMSMSNKTR